MKRLSTLKSFAAAAIVLGAFGAASAAHARSDVYFSIGLQSPGGYVQQAPVYSQPVYSQPVYSQEYVYVQPEPVYAPQRPAYVQPQYSRGWDRRGPYGDRDGDGIANVYDRDSHHYQRRHARLYGPYGDIDGDGVANRYDRFPYDPYRR